MGCEEQGNWEEMMAHTGNGDLDRNKGPGQRDLALGGWVAEAGAFLPPVSCYIME